MPHKRTANEPIGTCPCPFSNCDAVGTLHKYRAYSDDPARQRRAGRLYMRCDTHGMIQDQEWLLENGHIDTPAAADIKSPRTAEAEARADKGAAPVDSAKMSENDPASAPVTDDPDPTLATLSPETPESDTQPTADTWGFFE